MLNFCTLFNSNYAARGLLMYESLMKTCTDFYLYIFAFDDTLLNYLRQQKLSNTTIISLEEFEDERLLNVKSERSERAYCWTCESLTIQYCLNHFNVDHCTYIDADMYFYSNPQVLIDEMGDNDVLLTEHRYTESENVIYGGRFCVQFMTFRNTENGRKILDWWCDRCLEWCGEDHKEGLFGDQMYLEDWPERFDRVHILKHLGGGVAPWNMQQYTFFRESGQIKGLEISTGEIFDLVFFHYHALVITFKAPIIEFFFGGYTVPDSVHTILQVGYAQELLKVAFKIPLNNCLNKSLLHVSWKTLICKIWSKKNDNNYYYLFYGKR